MILLLRVIVILPLLSLMLYLVNLSTVKSHVFDDRAPHLDSLLRYAPSLFQMRLTLPLICVYHVITHFVYNVTLDT